MDRYLIYMICFIKNWPLVTVDNSRTLTLSWPKFHFHPVSFVVQYFSFVIADPRVKLFDPNNCSVDKHISNFSLLTPLVWRKWNCEEIQDSVHTGRSGGFRMLHLGFLTMRWRWFTALVFYVWFRLYLLPEDKTVFSRNFYVNSTI